jgi:hypothetical protein
MTEKKKIARRSFFSGLGLLAAAGVASKLSPTIPVPNDVAAALKEPDGDSYRLTEHVKKYYRSTTI